MYSGNTESNTHPYNTKLDTRFVKMEKDFYYLAKFLQKGIVLKYKK